MSETRNQLSLTRAASINQWHVKNQILISNVFFLRSVYLLLGVLIVLVGCATQEVRVTGYTGPERSTNEIAVLRLVPDFAGGLFKNGDVQILSVDGSPLQMRSNAGLMFSSGKHAILTLLPGEHAITTRYLACGSAGPAPGPPGSFYIADYKGDVVTLNLSFQAGRTYLLRGKLRSVIVTHGGDLWIEDALTHEVLTGEHGKK
jgi:hypothetical protein